MVSSTVENFSFAPDFFMFLGNRRTQSYMYMLHIRQIKGLHDSNEPESKYLLWPPDLKKRWPKVNEQKKGNRLTLNILQGYLVVCTCKHMSMAFQACLCLGGKKNTRSPTLSFEP